jgi:hypothetical protein
MKEKVSAFCMWALAVPVTAKGVDSLVHGATTLLGLGTALLGFIIAILGVTWWKRRLRRQWLKLEIEEFQYREMLKKYGAPPPTRMARGETEEE